MKNIIYILACVFLVSCMKDKGNYSYQEINTLSISGIKDLYTVDQMDVLTIKPKLAFKLNESKDLSYEWKINYETVSNDFTLNKPIATKFGKWPASLTVTNNTTKLKTIYDFEVEVINPYNDGLFILSKKADNTAVLGFQRRKPQLGTFKSDIFALANKEHGVLGKKPTTMFLRRGDLYICCEEGDKKISVVKTSDISYLKSINENVVMGGYTGTFKPAYLQAYYGGTGIVSEGKFFNYNNGNSEILYRPVEGDYYLENYITANQAFLGTYWLGFDKKQTKLITLSAGSNRYYYSEIKYWDFEGLSTVGMNFVAGAEYGKVDYSDPSRPQLKKLILQNNNNFNFYTITAAAKRDYTTHKQQASLELKLDMSLANIGDKNSVCVFGQNSAYWYIANNKKIYKIYANGGKAELLYTINRGSITTMTLNEDENKLFVGAEVKTNGENSGDIWVINTTKANTLIEPVHKDVCKSPVKLILKESE